MSLPAGIAVVPVRTPTLPPATHTNTYIVGQGRLTVIDPASPYEDEQGRLLELIRERMAAGEVVERIVLTHHHDDHVGGAEALRAALGEVPVLAHAETERLVSGRIRIDGSILDGDVLECGGRRMRAVFTPGHAPGHVALKDLDSAAIVAGDMVAGIGTILIDPRDGDLEDYLASLERLRGESASVLLPAHGDPITQADALLGFYVAHRHQRTEQIRSALDKAGAASADELAPRVYPELPPDAWKFAAAQIVSHLRWLERQGLAQRLEPTDRLTERRWELVR